jgi:hypothetical protein
MAVQAQKQGCVHDGIAGEIGTADRTMGTDASLDDITDKGTPGPTDGMEFDATGFLGGGGSCPGFAPIMFDDVDLMASASQGACDAGSLLAGLVIFAAYVMAAFIANKVLTGTR